METIYAQLKAAGVPLDHHESDLYAKVTPNSNRIVGGYEHKANVTQFTSQTDNAQWFDIPFAYDPFWEDKTGPDAYVPHPLQWPTSTDLTNSLNPGRLTKRTHPEAYRSRRILLIPESALT